VTSALVQAISRFSPGLPLAVAYSGGADSSALLHACALKWPGQVLALHVHHGLQAAADDFERHAHTFCEGLGVPLRVRRVDARHRPGQSPEEAARQARYQALTAMCRDAGLSQPVGHVALAQHADDQVETLLLALSRGGGLAGLSAMPATWEREGLCFYRPLLAVPAQEIRQYLREQGLGWIEDPTNSDEQLTRNRIRARLLPALADAFPQFRATFARSARHAAQAQELLLELADQDLAQIGSPPRLSDLRALSPARQANVLRRWLRIAHQTTPSEAQLLELLRQIRAATTRGHQVHIKVGRGFVSRCGPTLHWYNP
jgi:tRNA(Ile)-lysidine synthase